MAAVMERIGLAMKGSNKEDSKLANVRRVHKRKSMEPKKKMFLSTSLESRPPKRARLESINSLDELEQSAQNHALSPNSNGSEPIKGSSRSPSPHNLLVAPKMRFKQANKKGNTMGNTMGNTIRNTMGNTLGNTSEESRAPSEPSKRANDSPFRPWDDSRLETKTTTRSPSTPTSPTTSSATPTSSASPTSPLALPMVLPAEVRSALSAMYPGLALLPRTPLVIMPEQEEPLSLVKHARNAEDAKLLQTDKNGTTKTEKSAFSSANRACPSGRNYKNMTRERRVEANARERQRVHTITAAFDTLQKSIPIENLEGLRRGVLPDEGSRLEVGEDGDKSNKLSKLAIIKLATKYILLLGRLAGQDYSKEQSRPSVDECLDSFQSLVETETRGLRQNRVAKAV